MDASAVDGTFSVNGEDQETGDEKIDGHTRSLGSENKFQKAIAAWKGIDLTSLIPKLDSTATDIVTSQRDTLVQRKDLAQKTKDFRKLDDAGKLGEYKSLLKAYQAFIDVITNHGKQSSSAFLQLFSSLSEAPDPYPLLEASIDSLVVSEDTIPKLNSEKEQLHISVDRLTSQLEETERQLSTERVTRKSFEDDHNGKVKEVEASWTRVLEEKQNNWEAKERSLEDKVENQERLLKELKASYEVSQRLGQNSTEVDGSHITTTSAELDILTSDLEKTSSRLADMEARNEQLRMELAQAISQTRSDQENEALENNPAFVRLRSENSALLRKLDATRFEKDSQKNDWANKLRHEERMRSQLAAEKENLQSKVEKWADYEDLKRELEVLKVIEFSSAFVDEDDEHTDDVSAPAEAVISSRESPNSNGVAAKEKKDTLEQLLLARNKKLGDELTVLRVSHRDLQQQLENLQEEFSRTNAELERSQNLSATLENDLMKLQKEASSVLPLGAMSVAGTYTSRHPQSSRRGRSSPTSSIISGFDGKASMPSLEAIRAGEPVGGGSGILPMIQAQRDRFKQRNTQLEEELANTYNTVTSLRHEVASLQKDNLNLYEKTRYVSTYNRGTPSSSSSAYATKPNHTSIEMTPGAPSGPSLDRYRSQYEANISPFAMFRGRESARAYKRMSLPERMIFSITRMVLANRTSRNLFAGYCLALHVMVLMMLYWMGTTEVEKHASNLGEAAIAGAGPGGVGIMGTAADPNHGEWQQEDFQAS